MSEPAGLSSSDASRAARNVGVLMLASVVSKGALYLWQIALSVLLGPGEYGIYGTIGGMMAAAASVASFGMGLIVIRDVARAPEKAGKYWTSMLFAQTLLALVAYIGMNGFAIGYSEALRGYAALAGINLFVDLFGTMGYELLIARESMVKASLVDTVHIVLRIGLAWLAVTSGWGLLGVYVAAIATGVLRSVVLVGLNLQAGVRPEFPFDWETAKPLLVNSAPLALSAFLTLAYSHSDKLLTTGILSETVTGYLTAAFVISFGVIELLSVTVLVAAYPLLSRYYDDGRNPLFGYMIEKLTLYMTLVALPMALSISILADKIMLPLLGEAYAPAAGILRLLIWYTGLTIVGNVIARALMIQNRQGRLLLIRGASLALNVVLTAVLLLNWRDARGAVIASIIGECLVLIMLLATFRALGWQPQRIARSVLRAVVIAAPAAVLMLALREQFIALPLLGGLGVYAAGAMLARVLNAEDWDLVYRLAATMPGAALMARVWKRDVDLSW